MPASRRCTRLLTGMLAAGLVAAGCGNDETLAGIEFTSASQALVDDCRDAAEQLGFAVPCPMEHPIRSGPVRCVAPSEPGSADVQADEGCGLAGAFVLSINGIGADRTAESISHFVIEGTRLDGPDRRRGCQGEPARLGPHQGHVGTCDGIHTDHVAAFWDRDDVRYVVSAHGDSEVRRRVVQRVASATELVPPDA